MPVVLLLVDLSFEACGLQFSYFVCSKLFLLFTAGRNMPDEDIDKAIESGQLFDYTKGVCALSFFLGFFLSALRYRSIDITCNCFTRKKDWKGVMRKVVDGIGNYFPFSFQNSLHKAIGYNP